MKLILQATINWPAYQFADAVVDVVQERAPPVRDPADKELEELIKAAKRVNSNGQARRPARKRSRGARPHAGRPSGSAGDPAASDGIDLELPHEDASDKSDEAASPFEAEDEPDHVTDDEDNNDVFEVGPELTLKNILE